VPDSQPPRRPRNAERALSGALWTKEFAKPVALSSVHPADFPLAGTATRINFDLVTLRAWRSTNVSGLDVSYKCPANRTCRYLRRGDLGPKKFAEPVTLSSTHPADVPLAGTADRISFVLLACRARRIGESSRVQGAVQEEPQRNRALFAGIVQEGWTNIHRWPSGSAAV
jgi:hypothetical protein